MPVALAAGGLVAVLMAAAIAGLQMVRRYIGSHIAFEITGVSMESNRLSWPPVDVELNLRVHNRSFLDPSLRSMRFECATSSRSLVALEWPSGFSRELSIAANRDTDLSVKVSPRHIDPDSILSDLQGQARLVCRGPAVFSLWGIEFSRDLEFEKILW
jgi:hypothetical protein